MATATQILMHAADWERALAAWQENYRAVLDRYFPWQELYDLTFGKPQYLQRPHTDDMMQMCVDMGIDVPDFQPISYDGKTFRLK